MQSETIGAITARLQSIASDVSGLRRALDAEELLVSDRQYLWRCFDLLEMELSALRQYFDGLT
jgi:RNA polymerase-interacting CarD/CdnL/TRCF family regulator